MSSSTSSSSSSSSSNNLNSNLSIARTSCSSSAAIKMTNLLSSLYATSTSTHAIAFLLSCSNQQRKKLAILAGLPDAWISCNQKIKENVDDLVNQIIEELYNPFLFYRSSLMSPTTQTHEHPAVLFQTKQATPPLRQKNSSSFWQAPSGIKTTPWLPSQTTSTTFDAVVHFVQGGSGTGVHIGNGKILTCSHVIDTRADEELIDIIPTRVGRQKLVMFSSRRVFITECAATCETLDGTQDVAIVVLGAEIPLQSLPTMTSNGNTIDLTDESTDESESMTSLPFATVAKEAVKVGERLFCVGNPSSINLESIHPGTIEFSPPCFPVSVGYCEGYVDPVVNALNQEISDRGRAPTRGEKKKYMEAAGVIYENVEKGMFLKHSCWTYWGHSGAPLFNQAGKIVGLHNAWNDRTGIRHGQKLEYLVAVNMKCEEEAVVKTKKGKKKEKKVKQHRREQLNVARHDNFFKDR